jgi:hypothetical protein
MFRCTGGANYSHFKYLKIAPAVRATDIFLENGFLLLEEDGGRSGIRTLEGLTAPPVFHTAIAFATKPELVCCLDFAFTIAESQL